MAQLKLMKKEWFNWFDKTFLDNITSWTEYYYINPDSQHWISNNLIDIEDVPETTLQGVTYSWQDGRVLLNGEATANGNVSFGSITLKKGVTYYLTDFNLKSDNSVYWNFHDSTFANYFILNNSNRYKIITPSEDMTFYVHLFFTQAFSGNWILYPMLIQGLTTPQAFNPHLIKIENILGVVDLGSLNWIYNSTYQVFIGSLANIKKDNNAKVFTTEYTSTTSAVTSMTDNTIRGYDSSFSSNAYVYVKDSQFTDPVLFKQSKNGVYMVYIKADSPY